MRRLWRGESIPRFCGAAPRRATRSPQHGAWAIVPPACSPVRSGASRPDDGLDLEVLRPGRPGPGDGALQGRDAQPRQAPHRRLLQPRRRRRVARRDAGALSGAFSRVAQRGGPSGFGPRRESGDPRRTRGGPSGSPCRLRWAPALLSPSCPSRGLMATRVRQFSRARKAIRARAERACTFTSIRVTSLRFFLRASLPYPRHRFSRNTKGSQMPPRQPTSRTKRRPSESRSIRRAPGGNVLGEGGARGSPTCVHTPCSSW